VASVEIKTPEFKKSVSVEYEEFDATAFFEEIMPFVRTPHRLYRKTDEKTLELLIGLTHPVLMKVAFENVNKREDFIRKIRLYGFRLGDWKWI
jgi:hypothetical protein